MKRGVLRLLPSHVQSMLVNFNEKKLREIRIRVNQPIFIRYGEREQILKNANGQIYVATKNDVSEIVSHMSYHSLYAYEEEMKQGFVTVEGGHRIGICGQVILENGQVKNIKNISALHIRVAHEIIGCADRVIPWIINQNSIYNTLLVSPPGCGKTTLMRDMIRQLSNGNERMDGHTVAVVDERSEIAGCYQGISQNDIGIRTDVIDGCPKSIGLFMMIRTMGPEIIAVDEIGSHEDFLALQYACYSGVQILATIHGYSFSDIERRSRHEENFVKNFFQRIVILNGIGQVEGIYDSDGKRVDVI